MTSLRRTGRIRRPAAHPAPHDAIFDAYFGKDLALPDTAVPAAEVIPVLAASETDRLLRQSQELLSRLRQAIVEREGAE